MEHGPQGAGGQVWVAYPNPHHPDGWNLVVEWTPVSILTRHLKPEPLFWQPVIRPNPPGPDDEAYQRYLNDVSFVKDPRR